MEEKDIAIQITGLKKRYRLGVIGGGTLRGDLQSWWARVRHKEDPNAKIGSKTHGKNETFMALDGIDLTVYKGERVGIIGHNGAGKSTLLKLLSRVTGPTEGEIKLDGRISSMLEVGTGFNGELTGRENIYLNGAILGMTKAEIDGKIDKIIEFSECAQFIDTPVKRYSSGMYVKLAFAVASHLDSEILIMDEVLAVGDMAFQKKCLEKMSQVSQDEGRTILYVSHNMNTIRQLCDRCIVMDHGKIIFNGNVEDSIELYMKSNSEDSCRRIDLASAKRRYDYFGKKVKLTEFCFSTMKNRFYFDEKIRFDLTMDVKKAVENLLLRLDVMYCDNSRIGIFNTDPFSVSSIGKNQFCISFDHLMLPKGKYLMELDIYEIDDNKKHLSIDHPAHKISFEIIDDDPKQIVWEHLYMGHVRLGGLTVDQV